MICQANLEASIRYCRTDVLQLAKYSEKCVDESTFKSMDSVWTQPVCQRILRGLSQFVIRLCGLSQLVNG